MGFLISKRVKRKKEGKKKEPHTPKKYDAED